jgi:hypothetical protein
MKKIYGTLALLLCLHGLGMGQGLHLGLKAGSDLQKIGGVSFKDQFNFGYHLGGFIEIKLNDKWALQPEFYYSETRMRRGDSLSALYSSVDPFKIRLTYINIPLLLNWKIADQLSIQLGPKYGILSNKSLSIRENTESAIKSGDLSAVAGLQIKLPKIRIYARYQVGLNNINELPDQEKWKNQVIHAGVGLQLF